MHNPYQKPMIRKRNSSPVKTYRKSWT